MESSLDKDTIPSILKPFAETLSCTVCQRLFFLPYFQIHSNSISNWMSCKIFDHAGLIMQNALIDFIREHFYLTSNLMQDFRGQGSLFQSKELWSLNSRLFIPVTFRHLVFCVD